MTAHETDERPWTILERATGDWKGTETMAPDGLAGEAELSARLVLGGRGLASEYTQRIGGRVTLETHTVIHWDDDEDRFVMHFFSAPGATPAVFEGDRTGDRLVFEGSGPGGAMRQTFAYGDDWMRVTTETPDGDDWTVVFEGRYTPVGPAPSTTPGAIAWLDLTVPDADAVRDFYRAVVGWSAEEVSMGEYADYSMLDAGGTPVAGVCHARGANAGLPPAWLAYAVVADLDAALAAVEERGGRVVNGPRRMGSDRMAVIEDPAGAVLALYEAGGAGG